MWSTLRTGAGQQVWVQITSGAYSGGFWGVTKIYKCFTETPPPPKIVYKWPTFNWDNIFRNFDSKVIFHDAKDVLFSILHNIYPTRERLLRCKLHPNGLCPECNVVENTKHKFMECKSVFHVWNVCKEKIDNLSAILLTNDMLINMNFMISQNKNEIFFILTCYLLFIHNCFSSNESIKINKLNGFMLHMYLKYKNMNLPYVSNNVIM